MTVNSDEKDGASKHARPKRVKHGKHKASSEKEQEPHDDAGKESEERGHKDHADHKHHTDERKAGKKPHKKGHRDHADHKHHDHKHHDRKHHDRKHHDHAHHEHHLRHKVKTIPEDPEENIANVPVSLFNVVNYMYNPLLAAMPLAVAYAGPHTASIAILIMGFTVVFSNIINIRVVRTLKVAHYQEVVKILFPKNRFMFFFVSFVEFSKYILVLCMLCMFLTDASSKFFVVVNPEWTLTKKFRIYIICILSAAVLFPLSALKKTTRLAKLALVSWACMTATLILMILRYHQREGTPYTRIMRKWQWKIPELAHFLSICLGAFSNHRCCFVVYISLQKVSIDRWTWTLGASHFLAALNIIAYGYIGFATFFFYTQGNIFENYCLVDTMIVTARCLYSVAIFCFFPVNCSFARQVMKHTFLLEEVSAVNFYLMTCIVVVLPLLISFTSRCVAAFFLYYGTINSTLLVYIFPAWFYLKIANPKVISLYKLGAMLILCLGTFFLFYATIAISVTIQKLWALCSHAHEMHYCDTEQPF